jgi:hypothetical protein
VVPRQSLPSATSGCNVPVFSCIYIGLSIVLSIYLRLTGTSSSAGQTAFHK